MGSAIRRRRGAVLLEDPVEVGGHGGRRPYPRRRDASSATNGAMRNIAHDSDEEQEPPAERAGRRAEQHPGDDHRDRCRERRHGDERQPAWEHHLTAQRGVVLEVGQEVVEVRDGAGLGGGGAGPAGAEVERARPRSRS